MTHRTIRIELDPIRDARTAIAGYFQRTQFRATRLLCGQEEFRNLKICADASMLFVSVDGRDRFEGVELVPGGVSSGFKAEGPVR